jgi:TRAP-type C4-dicarboxylate transport system substrate-binding protein
LPKDLQEIVTSNINEAAIREREDIRNLNTSLRNKLTEQGMIFNETDANKFRAALRAAGFYSEWKEKYGPEAWAIFEKQVGALT